MRTHSLGKTCQIAVNTLTQYYTREIVIHKYTLQAVWLFDALLRLPPDIGITGSIMNDNDDELMMTMMASCYNELKIGK